MSNEAKRSGNGHDKPKTPSQNPSAIRMRKAKERRLRGAIVLRNTVIEPDLISALVQLGWIHGIEAQNASVVEHALFALVLRSLQAGVTPSEKPLLEVDLQAVRDAWIWAKPGSQVTPENASRALKTGLACARLVGFGPQEFDARLREMADLG